MADFDADGIGALSPGDGDSDISSDGYIAETIVTVSLQGLVDLLEAGNTAGWLRKLPEAVIADVLRNSGIDLSTLIQSE